jgi:hypothetical protein
MDAPSPTGRPAASSIATTTRGARAEIRAVALYALWAGLALLANTLGIATLPAGAGLILIAGIGLTGALFVGLTRIPGDERPTASTIIAAQVLMGLIWATLYAYFASGTPLLAAGMYATAIAFALPDCELPLLRRLMVTADSLCGHAAAALGYLGRPRSTGKHGRRRWLACRHAGRALSRRTNRAD